MNRTDLPSFSESGVSLNPFSVGYVQPGVIPYFFESAFLDEIRSNHRSLYIEAFTESHQKLVSPTTWIGCRFIGDKFAAENFRGQIIGPHGSGKSTMIESFAQYLELTGTNVVKFAIHNKTRKLSQAFLNELRTREPSPSKKTVVILDGYEQLDLLNRLRLRRICRRKDYGLLVTSHRRKWFAGKVLYRTAPSDAMVEKIVGYVLDGQDSPGEKLLQRLRRRHKDNIRAILDSLYDWWNDTHQNQR